MIYFYFKFIFLKRQDAAGAGQLHAGCADRGHVLHAAGRVQRADGRHRRRQRLCQHVCHAWCAPSRARAAPGGALPRGRPPLTAARLGGLQQPAGGRRHARPAPAPPPVTGARRAQATRCGPTAASRRRWWPARSPACSATSCTASATTRARSGCWCCRASSWALVRAPPGPAGGAPADTTAN